MNFMTDDEDVINQQRKQQIKIMRNYALRNYFTNRARQRLSNIKLVDKEKYNKILDMTIAMVQNKDLESIMTDEELKQFLQKLSSDKKGFNIRRK
jgi:DNA-binding TFAR19-related protein (PDSD5 family)